MITSHSDVVAYILCYKKRVGVFCLWTSGWCAVVHSFVYVNKLYHTTLMSQLPIEVVHNKHDREHDCMALPELYNAGVDVK